MAQIKTLDEVKSIRDRAEAARHYAKSAALGLHVQNLAAELKLRAERKAGELLAQLSLRGGDRKSKSRHEILKLADMGIDRNKSARWQLEASIPENVFLAYLAAAQESGLEITNGKFRQECLNHTWFLTLDDAQERVDARRRDYNEERPGSAVAGRLREPIGGQASVI